jgi:LacI family transcriptional regulator
MTPKKKSVTMSDVAGHAGVSLKTVSNVVNDWPYVSDETRQKVWESIEAVGYRPNQMARSLVTGKTKSIGVVVPDVSNPFFGTAMRGCEDILYEGEYSIFLCNSNEDVEREKFYLDLLMSRAVDGLILWGTRFCCEELADFIEDDIALVTVDMGEDPITENHININVDIFAGAEQATRHLIQQGRTKIAHLQGPQNRATSDRRLNGFQQALAAAELPFQEQHIFSDRPTLRGGFRTAQRALDIAEFDAFFCYNDLMAIGAMVALKQRSISVPQDIAIIGFDDITMASLVSPALSTMHVDQYGLGKLTGSLALDLLKDQGNAGKSIVFPTELRARSSTLGTDLSEEGVQQMFADLLSSFSDNV